MKKALLLVIMACLVLAGCAQQQPRPTSITHSVVVYMSDNAQLKVGDISPLVDKVVKGDIKEGSSAESTGDANNDPVIKPVLEIPVK